MDSPCRVGRTGPAVLQLVHAPVAGRPMACRRHGGTMPKSGTRARTAVEARQPADAGLGPPSRRVVRPHDVVPRSKRAGTHSCREGTGSGAEGEASAGGGESGRVL